MNTPPQEELHLSNSGTLQIQHKVPYAKFVRFLKFKKVLYGLGNP
jgi:hypothetical protein